MGLTKTGAGISNFHRVENDAVRSLSIVPRIVCWLVLISCASIHASGGQPFDVGGDPRVHGSDFRITTFATGLKFPYGMVELPDGSILVATSNPSGGNYFASTGELRRLVDSNHDGVADDAGALLYSNLPGALTGLCRIPGLIFVASSRAGAEAINILREGATAASPLTLVGSIRFSFPAGTIHRVYALAARETPGQPGRHRLIRTNRSASMN
jgi:glucose/arabinose dehydrogenase